MTLPLTLWILTFAFAAWKFVAVKADYTEDQKALFKKFGKDLKENSGKMEVDGDVFKSMSGISDIYTNLMDMNCEGERKKIDELINKQKDLGLINWSTLYATKPKGTLIHNIEFDHIPPGSAHPFTDPSTDDNEIKEFERQAPTVAISNFDHRSSLWKQCSTNCDSSTPIMDAYKKYVEDGNHYCALFANLFCIKDIEKHISFVDRVSNTPAFDRYKDGFISLINLHYDYGVTLNNVLQLGKAKPSSAYCEMSSENPTATTTTTTPPLRSMRKKKKTDHCKSDKFTENGKDGTVYEYCKNVKGSYSSYCNGKERNLNIKEYENLLDWMDGKKTDNEMLSTCKLDTKWQDLFPKIDWKYDPKTDKNKKGDNNKCVSYTRKWLKST